MKSVASTQKIPTSRVATFDVFSIGLAKHHVAAILEFDVTNARKKIRELRKTGVKVSFNAWVLKVIATTLEQHPEAAAFLKGKRELVVFNEINISFLVEKLIDGKRVPLPIVIERCNSKSVTEITSEIEKSKALSSSSSDIVLNKRPSLTERFYYHLPGVLRRLVWKVILRNPRFAYGKMGNVSVTSVGMMGQVKGWFIHRAVHPISFGIGSVLKKPMVVGDEIKIREVLNATILLDHDVIDGAPMVRFIKDLSGKIERAEEL
ncbi:2-oxo acid dehydrogenase subunit E2 [Perlabentimonas gracilis]|uniref:2-oxo acid dehydrogenase subunit E2 n=1 Tax=Perlabentimonas gracilis TaxID=2715279 RepID=UPI001409F1A3|nr:2-oxo acid dehydrogenase subunit E2 [Perlabentimonas gracilis]NHB67156.1 2-oxo acid dehydrogenase subunit E2 [Perlabentimonas gracilis]